MVKRRRKVNERVNPFKKLQKPGKHVKRIVIGAAGLVIIAGPVSYTHLPKAGGRSIVKELGKMAP